VADTFVSITPTAEELSVVTSFEMVWRDDGHYGRDLRGFHGRRVLFEGRSSRPRVERACKGR
jgi:hypothetical protein